MQLIVLLLVLCLTSAPLASTRQDLTTGENAGCVTFIHEEDGSYSHVRADVGAWFLLGGQDLIDYTDGEAGWSLVQITDDGPSFYPVNEELPVPDMPLLAIPIDTPESLPLIGVEPSWNSTYVGGDTVCTGKPKNCLIIYLICD